MHIKANRKKQKQKKQKEDESLSQSALLDLQALDPSHKGDTNAMSNNIPPEQSRRRQKQRGPELGIDLSQDGEEGEEAHNNTENTTNQNGDVMRKQRKANSRQALDSE